MKRLFLVLTFILAAFLFSGCIRTDTDLVIYFVQTIESGYYICSIDEGGGDFKKIAGPFVNEVSPVCSSDGLRIVFSKNVTVGPDNMTQIWTMNTDGSHMRQETSPAAGIHHRYPAWSDDSRYIYFVQYDDSTGLNYSSLYRLDVKSGAVTANAAHNFYNENSVACYGNYVAYYDISDSSINAMDIRTNINTYSAGNYLCPTFFPDGKLACSYSYIIYIYLSDFSSYSTIDFTAQNLVPISLAISPDGERIAFINSLDGNLYIYDIRNGGNAVLLRGGNPCSMPNYLAKPK